MLHLDYSAILDDHPAQQDSLGFDVYADTLAEILSHPSTRTPLTLGLFGSWGSGKTSLMSMIRTRIDAARHPDYHTIWFNAWKYNQEDTLWRALILRVLESLRPLSNKDTNSKEDQDQKKLIDDLDRLEESLYRTIEWEEVGKWTLDWYKALRGTVEGAADIALSFVPGGISLINILKGINKSISGKDEQAIAEAFRQEVKKHRREQIRFLDQFESQFQNLLYQHVINDKKSGRLIVFVDDLDRCLPQKAIQILEAIKLFLDVPGCIFVLGLDPEATTQAILTRYQDLNKSRQYLEKMIQLPFLLPPIEASGMVNFVNSLVPHLPDPRCSEVFAEGLQHNPRQVKRTINVFLLLWQLSQKKLPNLIHPVRLAKIVTIQHSFPELYQILREMPHLLRDLETHFVTQLNADNDSENNLKYRESLPIQIQSFIDEPILRALLTIHQTDSVNANFSDLAPTEIRPYIYLTSHAVSEADKTASVFEPQMVNIPAGTFIMGDTQFPNETPLHEVFLPNYQISRYPITNYEYWIFIQETNATQPRHWEKNNYPKEQGNHPVVYVSWHDASAYCKWLSQKTGKPYRLATEAEWEKAARGGDGKNWPWGNEWIDGNCNANAKNLDATTTPIGQFSPSGDSFYGIADMAGNVWEWCNSSYLPYPYQVNDGREAAGSGDRILRGGCFSSNPQETRGAYRFNRLPNSRDRNVGFRVVLSENS